MPIISTGFYLQSSIGELVLSRNVVRYLWSNSTTVVRSQYKWCKVCGLPFRCVVVGLPGVATNSSVGAAVEGWG